MYTPPARSFAAAAPAQADRLPATRPQHDALALTEGGILADIRLNDQTYCLRITRAGKLILTK